MMVPTSIPTLPPLKNTLPGRPSPFEFDTSARNLTKPSRPPLNRSTDWISIFLRTYGSLWNSCLWFCCLSSERCTVDSQILNAGNWRRSSCERPGIVVTVRLEWLGIVKADIVAVVFADVFRGMEKRRGRICHTSCCSLGSISEYTGEQ